LFVSWSTDDLEGGPMKYITTAIARLVLVLGLAAILAPAALGKGGVTVHTYAPPPLDAGSAVPNPDYARISPYARVSRGAVQTNARHVSAVTRSLDGGFDWGDAGIGAAATVVFVLIGIAPVFLLRQNRRRLART
jgi:hypothetical protein